MAAERLHIIVDGRVQGVGYRRFVQRRAAALRLTGWVRNRADHTVEAEAQGRPAELAAFLAALRDGPALARVTDLRAGAIPPRDDDDDFQIHF